MRNNSPFPFIAWSFFVVVLFLAYGARAQIVEGQPKANVCRHVAIMPRNNKQEPYTARCFIPSRTFSASSFSLEDLVDKEWRWIYAHNGTVSGQVVVRGINSVAIYSQKMCIDRGTTIGTPYRNFYTKIGESSKVTNSSQISFPVGDFKNSTRTGDAYAHCMDNPTQWYDFQLRNGTSQPRDAVQYIRYNLRGHFGSDTAMIPFNFSYSKDALDSTFRSAVKDVLNEESPKLPRPRSGVPLVISGYPFKKGLSVLGSPTAFSNGTNVTDVYHDLSALGWERASQAKTALSARINSAEEFPEKISRAELIQFTILSLLSIALYWQDLRSCAKERAEKIVAWVESTGEWICVTDNNFHQYINMPRTGTIRVVIALLSSIVSLAATILIFYDSSLRYQKILRITQGGVITYGKSIDSVDETNPFAGPEFSVAHWMEVHIITNGYYGLFTTVCVLAAILALVLIWVTWRFTLLREHHLDHRWVQRLLLIFPKGPILFLRTVFAPILPGKNSYDVSFQNLYEKLLERHGHHPIVEPSTRGLFNLLRRYKLNHFTANNGADNNEPPPISESVRNMNEVLGTRLVDRTITRNECEKAAEVLAANKFGMLSSIQALTLMYGHNLSAACDRYTEKGRLPSPAEIRGLARIWYVREIVVPYVEGEWEIPDHIIPKQPARINMETHSEGPRPGERPPYAGPNPFCPAIGVRPSVRVEQSELNDGVVYVTYGAREEAQ